MLLLPSSSSSLVFLTALSVAAANPTPVTFQRYYAANSTTAGSNLTNYCPSNAFSQDRSFCSNASLFCDGPVTWEGDCPQLHHCFLPKRLADGSPVDLTRNLTTNDTNTNNAKCDAGISILGTLAVSNIVEASMDILAGHEVIRNVIRSILPILSCSEDWSPTSSIVHAILEIVWAMVSAAIQRAHNPGMEFGPIFAFFILRPRAGFIVLIFVKVLRLDGFTYTLWDTVVGESILNGLALPFALFFLKSSGNADRCGLTGWTNLDARYLRSSYGFSVFAGCASILIFVFFCILWLNRQMDDKGNDERYLEKKMISPLIISFGTFVSNWILWGKFVKLAGPNYCEAGDVDMIISWVVHVFIRQIARAILGGSS